MQSVNIRSHHLKDFLCWLTMPEYRILSTTTLYNENQEKFAKEVINSYENGELKYLNLVTGIDDICSLCFHNERDKSCEKEDKLIILKKEELQIKTYNIEELVKQFDTNSFYFELMHNYQSNF